MSTRQTYSISHCLEFFSMAASTPHKEGKVDKTQKKAKGTQRDPKEGAEEDTKQ